MYQVSLYCSLGVNAFTRAYINFMNPAEIFNFRDKFDGYVFIDGKGMVISILLQPHPPPPLQNLFVVSLVYKAVDRHFIFRFKKENRLPKVNSTFNTTFKTLNLQGMAIK